MASYLSSGKLGGDLTASDGTSAKSRLGQTDLWSDDDGGSGIAIYVYAGAAITAGDACAIDRRGTAQPLTTNLANSGFYAVGFADFYAIGSAEYGWLKKTGTMTPRLLTLCAAGAYLYTTATAGALDDATTAGLVRGIIPRASNSGSTNRVDSVAIGLPYIALNATS